MQERIQRAEIVRVVTLDGIRIEKRSSYQEKAIEIAKRGLSKHDSCLPEMIKSGARNIDKYLSNESIRTGSDSSYKPNEILEIFKPTNQLITIYSSKPAFSY